MNDNHHQRDCLDIARLEILNRDAIHVKRRNFDLSKYYKERGFNLKFSAWNQIFEGYKRNEMRSIDSTFNNFAKICTKLPGQCIASIKPGYDNDCVLRFIVKDCYALANINYKQKNGFGVYSSQPVIVFELGECVEAKIDRITLKRIKRKAKCDSNVFRI